MKKAIALILVASLCSVAIMSIGAGPGTAQDKDKDLEGMDVLTRGPIHEAYAAPEALDPKPAPIVPKEPPAPIEEMPPDEKPEGSHVAWISGYWAWDDETAQFLWISGFWRDIPPGRQWVSGHWMQTEGGWHWASGYWANQTQTQVSYVPPPPPTLETGPSTDAPGTESFYSPGSWVYVEQKYRWRPGFWLTHRADWIYAPAHYVWTPAGYVFVDGYWDYEIHRRGLLFCPVRFTANLWTRPGWRWQPRYVVYPEVLVGSLFVRVDLHRYCFGDYFDARFLQHGFVPWVDYRLHRNIPEPFFRQVAINFRKEVNWERDLRKLYDDRRVGIALRPPVSIAEQQRFLREIAVNKSVKVGGRVIAVNDVKLAERNLHMVSTLAQVDKKVIPLQTVTKEQHTQALKTIEHHNEVRNVRKTTEAKILKETPVIKPTDVHQVGKLPTIPPHLVTPKTVTLPVAPTIPVHVEKVIPKYEAPKSPKLNPKPFHSSSERRLPEVSQAFQPDETRDRRNIRLESRDESRP